MMEVKLAEFTEASESPYKLALSRIKYLEDNNDDGSSESSGLAKQIVDLLDGAIASWPKDTSQLLQVLTILTQVHTADSTLSEEVARHEGFLTSLLQVPQLEKEGTEDVILVEVKKRASGLQDAFSLLSGDGLPFPKTELQSRLPLVFAVSQYQQESMEILIQQPPVVESADIYQYHDVGLVMWPAAVTLARWITKNPAIIANSAANDGILEIGAGCGLVGLTAATMVDRHCKQQQEQIPNDEMSCLFLTDYNPAVLENLDHNIRLNGLNERRTTVVGLDFFDQPEIDDKVNAWVDMNGNQRPQVGLILAADIICYSNDADLVCNTIQAALIDGGKAIVVGPDSSHRFGVEQFPSLCRNAGLQVEVTNLLADSTSPCGSLNGEEDDEKEEAIKTLLHDLEQTCRFTVDYELLMFTITKLISK